MYTYIHIYTYTQIHICTHRHIYTYIHTHIHTYAHTHIHTYTHTHIHTCTYICTYAHFIHIYHIFTRYRDCRRPPVCNQQSAISNQGYWQAGRLVVLETRRLALGCIGDWKTGWWLYWRTGIGGWAPWPCLDAKEAVLDQE